MLTLELSKVKCTFSAEPWGETVHVEADTVSLANIALKY